LCFQPITHLTEELHSFLSQSELSNFFTYIIRHTTQGQIQTIQKEVARTLDSCILDTIYFTENSLKMIENFTDNGVGVVLSADLYPCY